MKILKDRTLDELAELWRQTKAAEDAHRADRIGLEEAILKITGARIEGAETTTTEHYKVTTTGRVTYKTDWALFHKLASSLPEPMRPVRMKAELDTVGLRWLRLNEPDLYSTIADAITITPAKVGMKIEPRGDQ